ncbi:MAG: ectoine hydroxylase [Elainellaceae cyanobacterium]
MTLAQTQSAENQSHPLAADVYASRQSPTADIRERHDPVVHSSEPPTQGLTAEQAQFYDQNGYLFIERLFSEAEVQRFREELDRMAASDEIRAMEEAITEPNSGAVRSIFRAHELSPLFARLCRDPRILHIAEYLLGDRTYIHQSRINFKPGFFGKEFYWHSDFETWHMEDGMPRMRALSVSISLTDNTEFNGPLIVIPESHRRYVVCIGETPEDHYKESLKRQEYGVPDPDSLTQLVDAGGMTSVKGAAGSVVFFDCNMMHGSNSNISPYPRSNVFYVYNSVENALVDPFCGLKPRPEFIAARRVEPLEAQPLESPG